jgi:hypothetical protein
LSIRFDTALIPGAVHFGFTGLGVPGSSIPSTGLHGPSFLWNDITLPVDANKEIRGKILTVPSAGTFFAWEDGSFLLSGAPDGTYTFTYELYADGVDLGAATATITGGSPLPTLGRPAADTSAGLWTPSSGGALYPMLNEVSANDSNFINVAALSTCEMVLDNTAYPGGANQTLSYRAFSSTGNGLTVTLKQGSTTIASWSHALTGTPTLYTQTLTSGQIATIVAGPISVTLTST